jgi:L-lactate dehydrogenase
VAVQNVHAYIAGEQGDSEVPLWSTATIGGVPIGQALGYHAEPVEVAARQLAIQAEVVNAADEIIAGKGATSLAIGLAVAKILESALRDEHRVLMVCSRLGGQELAQLGADPDLGAVCLSLPSIVGRRGIERILPTPLSPAEAAALRASATALREAAARLGL